MDTIIYLYHSREPKQFITEKWQEREYCLIRLGIPSLLWQNLKKLEQGRTEEEALIQRVCISSCEMQIQQGQMPMIEKDSLDRKRRRIFLLGRRKRKRKEQKDETLKAKQEERQRKEVERERLQKELIPLLTELSELQTALCLLGDNPHWTYCVFEEFLQDKINTKLWWECWRIPRFEEYHGYVWAEELMQYATKDSFLILGYAPCLGRILRGYGVRMRSVKWMLKPEQYTETVQDFIEEFYQEYGLAISLQLLEAGEEWLRVRPTSMQPVNVLDFSQEEKLSACDVAKGSVWLDMDSLEGKERRIEVRCPQIAYFSLKKQWKQLQKEPIYLDTNHKNRYNT